MKLHFSNEWMRKKVSESHGDDAEVDSRLGLMHPSTDELLTSESAPANDRVVRQMRLALGVFVSQLRRQGGLSITDLAEQADVDEEELRNVERDPSFTATAYFIYQLSEFFNLPLANLSQMAGQTHAVDRVFYNKAVRYAAHSEDLSTMTHEETDALNAFVATLRDTAKVHP
ncbi:helix-turn-helix domain-containing protein [Dyella psychrodurans]|nr:helix-turn-helix transcriptional regulator [Dyella psychrodurans]